jgi:epoxyqueuosine reductase
MMMRTAAPKKNAKQDLSKLRKFLLRKIITDEAKKVGFDLVGFSPAKIQPQYLEVFDQWLSDGQHADMGYMEKIERRRDLRLTLPSAKSVICLGLNYFYEQTPLKPGAGRVARYAFGRDYHKIINKKLKQLESRIQDIATNTRLIETPLETKRYVDTGPLLERALAEQAGLGKIGKNGCLISKEYGSWIFLAEIISNLDLVVSEQTMDLPNRQTIEALQKSSRYDFSDQTPKPSISQISGPGTTPSICGQCTLCIDACPTGAIIAPGVIDSRLCISYLTIENKEKIPPQLAAKIKETKRIYGCDICQEVCPHNAAKQKPHANPELASPQIAGDQITATEPRIHKSLKTDADYLETFAGSPFMRIKKEGLTRNLEELH